MSALFLLLHDPLEQTCTFLPPFYDNGSLCYNHPSVTLSIIPTLFFRVNLLQGLLPIRPLPSSRPHHRVLILIGQFVLYQSIAMIFVVLPKQHLWIRNNSNVLNTADCRIIVWNCLELNHKPEDPQLPSRHLPLQRWMGCRQMLVYHWTERWRHQPQFRLLT